jgi:hypothetical protein
MKQGKIQLVTGSQLKQRRGSGEGKALSLQTVQEKNLKAKINELQTNNIIENIRDLYVESMTSTPEIIY